MASCGNLNYEVGETVLVRLFNNQPEAEPEWPSGERKRPVRRGLYD
ncbi:MAG: hypothetical protein ACLUOI_38115 [Eisenbergiella sp.]